MTSPTVKYDPFARLRVILLNEYRIVYDYCPPKGHCTKSGGSRATGPGRSASCGATNGGNVLKHIQELVLGSVALNYGQHLPVTKIHHLSDRLICTSVVFGHVVRAVSPLPNLPASPTPSVSSRTSSRAPVPLKFGLTILWETSGPGERDLIDQFVRKESHLLDCFMQCLKDAMLEGLYLQSASVFNESTKQFLTSVHSALSANYLSANVSLEMYARELSKLIRHCDLKTNGFFVSRLLSTALAYCDKRRPDANVGKQIVITTTNAERRPLLERCLIVLSYFINDNLRLKTTMDDPKLSVTVPDQLIQRSSDLEMGYDEVDATGMGQPAVPSTYTISPNNSSDDLVRLRRRESLKTQLASGSANHNNNYKDVVAGPSTSSAMDPPQLLNAIPKRLTTKTGPNSQSGRKSRDESLGYGSLSDSGSSNELMANDESHDTMDAATLEELASKLAEQAIVETTAEVAAEAMPLLSNVMECQPSTSKCCGQQEGWPDNVACCYIDDDVVVTKELPKSAAELAQAIKEAESAGQKDSVEQTKLYMKEYLSLRFQSPPCASHDQCFIFDDETPSSDMATRSSESSQPPISENKRDSMFAIFNEPDEADDESEEVRPCRNMPGFFEVHMPLLFDQPPTPKTTGGDLDWQPLSLRACLNENRLLAHGQLQAVFLHSKYATITELTRDVACECDRRTRTVLHVDLDNWSVNIIDADNGVRLQDGLQSTLVGRLCDSVAVLANLNMKPQFIIDFFQTKLDELHMKSQLLSTLLPKSSERPYVPDTPRSPSPYACNPLLAMSRAAEKTQPNPFYPIDSGIESSFSGNSLSSSCTAISADTVRAAVFSVDYPLPSPLLGIDNSDVQLLMAMIHRQEYYHSSCCQNNYHHSSTFDEYSNYCSSSCSCSGHYGANGGHHSVHYPPTTPSHRPMRSRAATASIAETAL